VTTPNGSRLSCSFQGVCGRVDPASHKEGDSPKESMRATAGGESSERPAACTGASCSERVALPRQVESQLEKQEPSRSAGGRQGRLSIVEKIGILLEGVADTLAPKPTPPDLTQYYTPEDTFAVALIYVVEREINEIQRNRIMDKAAVLVRLDEAALSAYTAERKADALFQIRSFSKIYEGITDDKIGSGAFELGGFFFTQSDIALDKDIYRVLKNSSVTSDGVLIHKNAFSAVADKNAFSAIAK
jgi:hypothetical protein